MRGHDLVRAARTGAVLGAFALIVFGSTQATAHGPNGHQNVKVLPKHLGKRLGKGMKELSRGLGVKCEACHVKDHFDSDKKAVKLAARQFFAEVTKDHDPAARAASLSALLLAMKLEAAKSEGRVWQAFEIWSSRPSKAKH